MKFQKAFILLFVAGLFLIQACQPRVPFPEGTRTVKLTVPGCV